MFCNRRDTPNKAMKVGSRPVGPGYPALLVAEIGGNHGGDPGLAAKMVSAAAVAGAGAVKFQAYRTPAFLSRLSPYYEELALEELTFERLAVLVGQARRLGLAAGLTVFDEDGLALADECRADFIKISSGDLTNHDLLARAARAQQPLFISTGAATETEVRDALAVLKPAKERLVLLQCTSLYPAPPESANLAAMVRWLEEGLAAGYSDHVLGPEAAIMALTLGAVVLEKHFTIDRALPGGDNSLSALPADFRELARWVPLRESLWGAPVKSPHPLEAPMRPIIRRAVLAARELKAGRRLNADDLALMRPPPADDLLGPDCLAGLIGRVLKENLAEGAPLTWAALEAPGA